MENRITHVSLSSCENRDNSNHCDFKLSIKLCSVLRSKVIFAAELPVVTVDIDSSSLCVHMKGQTQEQV